MDTFKNEFAADVERAVRDLFSDKDKFCRIDIDEVAGIITRFVIDHENFATINDANQYEACYSILGKAVAITQGWKVNCADEILLPSQTRENLLIYMTETYGAGAVR